MAENRIQGKNSPAKSILWIFCPFICNYFIMVSLHQILPPTHSSALSLFYFPFYCHPESVTDPNNALLSWDPTLVNPCTWFHVTCNKDNSVVRVQVQNNSFSRAIPRELGNLTKLVSLGLQINKLSGPIPSSLGNLKSLRYISCKAIESKFTITAWAPWRGGLVDGGIWYYMMYMKNNSEAAAKVATVLFVPMILLESRYSKHVDRGGFGIKVDEFF
ncbi:hypothetical protein RND71_040698 [Anisodus tanguticus]|uniref:Leucine-rich repeat-containing N-terminal plant-type domain-containing protein n=1 Tax=Anisodus tanguticus TaxID=243964 RepID=A0AAE1UTK9_9SOLA|nr:hypothetical protein RND71_040698 [Anisodus tanguticus]